MERAEAGAIYEQGREVVVGVLVELAAQNALLTEQVAKLSERVARQDERIAELERRLARNSQNSSTPPSQDPPSAPERKRPPASGRKQGAQPGHPGKGRRLAPLEAVDRVIEHWPRRCGCGHLFRESERETVGEPARHQVSELPEIAVKVTEHRLEHLRCPDCGKSSRAELPDDVPGGAFGPRFEAAVATLAVRNRVSRRDTTELLRELFGAQISTGTVDAIVARTGEALASPHQGLLGRVRSAAAVNVDETGWRLRGKRRTLWGAITPDAAAFRIAPDRHEREAKALLGEEFEGIVCSDRWWAYDHLEAKRRQVCWAHLVRDFTAHAEGLAEQREFGEAGLRIAEGLFCAWAQFRDDADRARLAERIAPLRRELRALLERGARKSPKDEAPPALREQPLEALAGALYLRRGGRRGSDQQSRRARAAGRGHLSQALARQPIRSR